MSISFHNGTIFTVKTVHKRLLHFANKSFIMSKLELLILLIGGELPHKVGARPDCAMNPS